MCAYYSSGGEGLLLIMIHYGRGSYVVNTSFKEGHGFQISAQVSIIQESRVALWQQLISKDLS